MSHALLLRLFLSPSFFSINVALQYLTLYHNNIGITYYLTRRLSEFNENELRDVWGPICHLLVTMPSKSRALESFVLETCERSAHMAMFTLWFMQAHINDLAMTDRETKSFTICQRVLLRCHEIIFEDTPKLETGPYSTMKVKSRKLLRRKRVRHHVEPALVGIGCVLAGTPGMPKLTELMGYAALEQGRVEDSEQHYRSLEADDDDDDDGAGPSIPRMRRHDESNDVDREEDDDSGDEGDVGTEAHSRADALGRRRRDTLVASAINHSRSQRPSEAARTTPSLSRAASKIRRSEVADDPFGQLDRSANIVLPSHSTPAVPTARGPRQSGSGNMIDDVLRSYDAEAQRALLQSNYCRSEVQFVLSLESISNRLLVVPKMARVSALRAELTSLNHKLPAEVCMPMWCNGIECPSHSEISSVPHHRIVRVPPGESVVLNSAERAPYLLYLEILHGDLDFDPDKRPNRELLKGMVRHELDSSKASRGPFRRSGRVEKRPTLITADSSAAEDVTEAVDEDDDVEVLAQSISSLSPSAEFTSGDPDEEVDLVEQVYGRDLSVHQTPDLADSFVLPTPPKNKALDVATWTRSTSSTPSSPAVTPPLSDMERIHANRDLSPPGQISSSPARRPTLSLDEYSQRMRTAAVMLAQLNASIVKEIFVARPTQDQSGPSAPQLSSVASWLPMSNWLIGVNTENPSGPIHPSISGSAAKASQVGTTRMRLPPTEVAAIRDRIMQEMLVLEEERMGRMQANPESDTVFTSAGRYGNMKTADDELIIRKELNKEDPSAVVFSESWATKKSRIRQGSPYGHLASWDCVSVIVKTGADLRQEQLALQLIREFGRIWKEDSCQCWVRPFQILITGGSSGLVETITDAVSVHSIKKALYARRVTDGGLGQVTLLDHFINAYGDVSSAKFARAQRNFIRSLAGYSVITYLLQIKDRHNGNILLDRDGHLIHIDFGFMLSNSPGNIGFEAAPFKLTFDYVEVLGGVDSDAFREFKRLFHEGFQSARKHCDRFIIIVELMQKKSSLPCFAALGEMTAQQLRDRFQPKLSQQAASELIDKLIMSSLGSNWTRLYDSFQYYSQSIL